MLTLRQSWLFVCHQSKFNKPGDYHTFAFAGIQFFIVLGQDLKLRAFHNICRHRAYTVVRKSCGTTKLFSCKYHGWQYDDTGSLVKAPKFELSPGFKPVDNGLFEVKLLRTQEGLVRVNFDASTLRHPFRDMTSSLSMGDSTWIDGFDKETEINWKVIGMWQSDTVTEALTHIFRRGIVKSSTVVSVYQELATKAAQAEECPNAWTVGHVARDGR